MYIQHTFGVSAATVCVIGLYLSITGDSSSPKELWLLPIRWKEQNSNNKGKQRGEEGKPVSASRIHPASAEAASKRPKNKYTSVLN